MRGNHFPAAFAVYPDACKAETSTPRLPVPGAGLDAHSRYNGSVAVGTKQNIFIGYFLVCPGPVCQLAKVVGLCLDATIRMGEEPVIGKEPIQTFDIRFKTQLIPRRIYFQ